MSEEKSTRMLLADRLQVKLGIKQKLARDVVRVIFDLILEIIKEEGYFTVNKFGRFFIKEWPQMQRRNPSTGKLFVAKATKKLKFKATKRQDIN